MISIETHITCDFPGGGPDPLSPLWIRTCRINITPMCRPYRKILPNISRILQILKVQNSYQNLNFLHFLYIT